MLNSWNEWDPLREVIVGTLEGKVKTPPDEIPVKSKYTMRQHYPCPLSDHLPHFDHEAWVSKRVDEYIMLMKGEEISVKRPIIFDFHTPTCTPDWQIPTQNGTTCPRDVFFIAGSHVIEAPMSWRCRYFENIGYRDLMMDYFESTPRMRWSAAPKPRLLPESYEVQVPDNTLSNEEILFDAADCRRFGKDIFVQNSHTANRKGIEWIRRTLAPDGVRVHEFGFETNTFSHIDAKITPISEDTLLWCKAESPTEEMFQLFRENEWNLIECPPRVSCVSAYDMTGPGIHMNMFALAPNKVIVENHEVPLIKLLRENGIDVIEQNFSVCYQFGGGLNCWTLDTVRDGNKKSYFPTLDVEQERLDGRADIKGENEC